MYKTVLSFLFSAALLLCSQAAGAQLPEDEDPDAAGAPMPNVAIGEAKPIKEVVEGVGTVLSAGVSFRREPNIKSSVVRTSTKAEKVLILGESGDWLFVRMYNNKEAYINKKYVRTEKIFRDESTTTNSMDKKASFDVQGLISRFDRALRDSPYAARYQALPSLRLTDARKSGGVMTLRFVYSCVDLTGKMIPSYKQNDLKDQMKTLLELIFSKLLLTNTSELRAEIRVPVFDQSGAVKNADKIYAEIVMKYDDIDMRDVRENGSSIWKYVESTMPLDKLFESFM